MHACDIKFVGINVCWYMLNQQKPRTFTPSKYTLYGNTLYAHTGCLTGCCVCGQCRGDRALRLVPTYSVDWRGWYVQGAGNVESALTQDGARLIGVHACIGCIHLINTMYMCQNGICIIQTESITVRHCWKFLRDLEASLKGLYIIILWTYSDGFARPWNHLETF